MKKIKYSLIFKLNDLYYLIPYYLFIFLLFKFLGITWGSNSPLLWLLVIPLFIWLGFLLYRLDHLNKLMMEEFARENGFNFKGEIDYLLYSKKLEKDSGLFSRGKNQTIFNYSFKENKQYKFELYNYSYDVPRGQGYDTYNFTVFEITQSQKFEPVWIYHRTFLKNLKDWLTATKITTESNEFNRKYKVRAKNRSAAFHFLNPIVMAALIDSNLKISLGVSGNSIKIFKYNYAWDWIVLEKMYDLAKKIVDALD